MKLHLMVNDISLGFLAQDSNGYAWIPNTQNINFLKQNRPMVMESFLLPSEPCLFDFIPYHFEEFLPATERVDLIEKVGIVDSDSEFIKLCKLGLLDYFDELFVIKCEV